MSLTYLTQGRPNTVTRPVGFPRIVNGPLPNSGLWYDDFLNVSTTTSLGGAGNWLATVKGNAGSYGFAGTSPSQSAVGQFSLATGSVAAGDGYIVDKNARAAAQNTFSCSVDGPALAFLRMNFGTTRTNVIHGAGFVATSIAEGTDWVTDPDTTLAGTGSIVLTRNSDAYSGDAAGDIVARLYDATPTAVSLTMMAAADVGALQYSFEFYRPASSLAWYCYTNGVLMGTLSHSSSAGAVIARASFGILTQTSASTRNLSMDAMACESSLANAR